MTRPTPPSRRTAAAGAPSGIRGTRRQRPARGRRPSPSSPSDGLGSSIARVGEAAPLLAIVGHIDEIGLIVTHIDEKGFLWFAPIGGWDPQILVGQRVEVRGRDGHVPGSSAASRSTCSMPEQRKKVVELKGLHIDVGAADREEAAALVRVGDPVVIARRAAAGRRRPPCLRVDGQPARRLRRARDRLRRCAERGGPRRLSRRRRGAGGDRPLRRPHRRLRAAPGLAIAVDVTHATDAPGVDEKEIGSHPLGSGPVIGRGSTLSPKLFELLVETAEAEGIEHSISASGRGTSTDADALQISREGIPTGLVSIPSATCTRRSSWSTWATSRRRSTCLRRSARLTEPEFDLSAADGPRGSDQRLLSPRSGTRQPTERERAQRSATRDLWAAR